mmetsp:Transcript_66011/g.148967  ORF Transcript_66011/g.148967 Transcript_66011/m.148967 type:complete len:281 (+) Transcript_66011:1595-2437(+)
MGSGGSPGAAPAVLVIVSPPEAVAPASPSPSSASTLGGGGGRDGSDGVRPVRPSTREVVPASLELRDFVDRLTIVSLPPREAAAEPRPAGSSGEASPPAWLPAALAAPLVVEVRPRDCFLPKSSTAGVHCTEIWFSTMHGAQAARTVSVTAANPPGSRRPVRGSMFTSPVAMRGWSRSHAKSTAPAEGFLMTTISWCTARWGKRPMWRRSRESTPSRIPRPLVRSWKAGGTSPELTSGMGSECGSSTRGSNPMPDTRTEPLTSSLFFFPTAPPEYVSGSS